MWNEESGIVSKNFKKSAILRNITASAALHVHFAALNNYSGLYLSAPNISQMDIVCRCVKIKKISMRPHLFEAKQHTTRAWKNGPS